MGSLPQSNGVNLTIFDAVLRAGLAEPGRVRTGVEIPPGLGVPLAVPGRATFLYGV